MSQCLPIYKGVRDPLHRLLRSLIKMAGPDTTGVCSEVTPWASALYDGAIYRIILELKGDDAAARAESLARTLPDAEFCIKGHIIAEVTVEHSRADDAQTHYLGLIVLMLADGGAS